MLVALVVERVPSVVRDLGNEFYADPEAMKRAATTKTSVNLIHLPSAIKVDLFVAGGTPIDLEQLDRRVPVAVGPLERDVLYVYTAEDILLKKLRWYRLGGEVSDRQWRDIAGILSVQGERIDHEYVRSRSRILDVEDLFDRALAGTD